MSLKLTSLKKAMSKATPQQAVIIKTHFNQLWEAYDLQVRDIRQLWQHGRITKRDYNKATKDHFQRLRVELKQVLKGVVA